jgi:hypothetical protein
MKVQTKLILLLLLLSAIFAAAGYFYQVLKNKQMYIMFEEGSNEKNIYFDKLMKLKGANLEALAFDYTYWDEMVDFVSNNDIEWAKKNIDENVLDTYQANAIWIYKIDLSRAYSISNQDDAAALKEFVLPKETISSIFLKERFCHFFINTSAGLMEIRGSTIHPGSDPDRKTPPLGYFFAGRLWKKEYIKELADLASGEINISVTRQTTPDPKILLRSNVVIFSRELKGWTGKTAAYIYVRIYSKGLENYKRSSRNASILFISFLVINIIFIITFLMRSVHIPLAMISYALKKENPDSLHNLARDTSEFGDISRLISRFFKQKEDLVKEIAERKKAEEQQELLLKDLEDTNKVMVGRELKMIEFKKEINRLNQELGRQAPYKEEDKGF